MKFMPRKLGHAAIFASFTAVLSACGGGGGGSSGGGGDNLPPSSDGRYVILSWEGPSTREDDSCLDSLQSYEVSYGLSPGNYEKSEEVRVEDVAPSSTGRSTACGEIRSYSYMVENLSPASWYFAVRAVDADGQVSDYSNEVLRTVE